MISNHLMLSLSVIWPEVGEDKLSCSWSNPVALMWLWLWLWLPAWSDWCLTLKTEGPQCCFESKVAGSQLYDVWVYRFFLLPQFYLHFPCLSRIGRILGWGLLSQWLFAELFQNLAYPYWTYCANILLASSSSFFPHFVFFNVCTGSLLPTWTFFL